MNRPNVVAALFVSLLFQAFFSVSHAAPLRALVYKGPGSCDDQCSEAAANVAQRLGIQTRFIGPEGIRPGIFKGVHLWIQPGGNAIRVVEVLRRSQMDLIRDFVAGGGGYVGFCAGAFFADEIVDDFGKVKGLNILPLPSKDLEVDSRENGIMLSVLWRRGGIRDVYFNGGASFLPDFRARMNVLGIYSNGEIAALHSRHERGNVAVAGFHPEAPDSWKAETGMPDRDGRDWDLAAEMVVRALPVSSAIKRELMEKPLQKTRRK